MAQLAWMLCREAAAVQSQLAWLLSHGTDRNEGDDKTVATVPGEKGGLDETSKQWFNDMFESVSRVRSGKNSSDWSQEVRKVGYSEKAIANIGQGVLEAERNNKVVKKSTVAICWNKPKMVAV